MLSLLGFFFGFVPVRYSDPTGHYLFEEDPDETVTQYNPGGPVTHCANFDCWITDGPAPLLYTQIKEPKPEFPIASFWNQSQGDSISRSTDYAGVAVSSFKSGLSVIGIAANLGFPILGDVSLDRFEDLADWVSIFFNVLGETANGNTRTAFESNGIIPNPEVTVVLGQDVSQDFGLLILDRIIPGSEFDLVVNVYEIHYGIQKLRGEMPNQWEIRISRESLLEIRKYQSK